MSLYIQDDIHLSTESDVEQKVVLPLLTTPEPDGLGFNTVHLQTKISLKKLAIDKNRNAKLYFPDYLVLFEGLPLIVVEVKKLGEDLTEAYRESRLYAHEINAMFKGAVNPCTMIMATDGKKLIAGEWDDNQPIVEVTVDNWVMSNNNFSWFVDNFGLRATTKRAKALRVLLRKSTAFKKPLHLLGGKHIQNTQTRNSFGETISIQYRHLFNPDAESERTDIVTNAYVKVDKHQTHIDPIDKIIRKKIAPSISDAVEIENNVDPKEIISRLNVAHLYNNQVILLIGSVGSGKTTFTTYLKEVALDRSLSNKLAWTRLDLNNAPVSPTEIYDWLKKAIIRELETKHNEIDVDDFTISMQIYQEQVESFSKRAGVLLGIGSDTYNTRLFDLIESLRSNLDETLKAYIKFFVHDKGKELIVVLDNCDKRNLEEQLLMFEVANWLKENVKSIVFLPLRETTFDHFRNQKPLDTVIKDLIFRINPPPLERVIYNRMQYAARLEERSETQYYVLPNGFKVKYPSSEELFYLKSILKSLFQNAFFKKLISGLTGRNIRRGIEIFLDFCKSGHITEAEILQMKHSKGNHSIANHIISRIFLRGNRVYYSDADTRIKNLFFSDPSDKLPDPFVRLSILEWLMERHRIKGPSGILGFHKITDLLRDLTRLGHELERTSEEIKTLIKYSLIISESQDTDAVDPEELISINSPGIIHLELLNNIDYLSACAEDVWYNNDKVANEILTKIREKGHFTHLSLQTGLANSESLITYLEEYETEFYTTQKSFLAEDAYRVPVNFEQIKSNIQKGRENLDINTFKEITVGTILIGTVVNISQHGLIIELEKSSQTGFCHASDIPDHNYYENETYTKGQEVKIKIKAFKPKFGKYNVALIAE